MIKHLTPSLLLVAMLCACGTGSTDQQPEPELGKAKGRAALTNEGLTLVDCDHTLTVLHGDLPEKLVVVIEDLKKDPSLNRWVQVQGLVSKNAEANNALEVRELIELSNVSPCEAHWAGTYVQQATDGQGVTAKLALMEDGTFQFVIIEQGAEDRRSIAGNWRLTGEGIEFIAGSATFKAIIDEHTDLVINAPDLRLDLRMTRLS